MVTSETTWKRLIARGIKLERAAFEAKQKADDMRADIKARMRAEKLVSAKGFGNQGAKLVTQTVLHWNVEALKRILGRKDFEKLCPRKADAAALRKLWEERSVLAVNLRRCVSDLCEQVLLVLEDPHEKVSVTAKKKRAR